MSIVVSFCIPVFNGGRFIAETVRSILDDARDRDDVEVVVFDGGSTDDTEDVVRAIVRTDARVRYVRANKRGGIDRDLCACVEEARGEYCWLFGGDDLLKAGALGVVGSYLDSRRDLVLVRHSNCTIDMVEVDLHPLLGADVPVERNLGDLNQRADWFRRAENTEAICSFISGIIVRRTTWGRGQLHPLFEQSCWGHVSRIFGLMAYQFLAVALPDVLVARRGENDSFLTEGLVRRYALAIERLPRIARHHFGDGNELRHVRRMLRAEFGIRRFLYARSLASEAPHDESEEHLWRLFAALHPPEDGAFLLRNLICRRMPLEIYLSSRTVLRHLRYHLKSRS